VINGGSTLNTNCTKKKNENFIVKNLVFSIKEVKSISAIQMVIDNVANWRKVGKLIGKITPCYKIGWFIFCVTNWTFYITYYI
jgi:hypothetical protein